MGSINISLAIYFLTLSTSLMISKAMSDKSEKEVYYDFTEEINEQLNGNEEEVDFSALVFNLTGENSPNVFYSTDKFLHEMGDLSPVSDLLDANGLEQSKLYLSFQLLNNSGLSFSRFADVFYELPNNADISSLQKHVSGVLVELNSVNSKTCPRPTSNAFKTTWKTSFPKYARAISNSLLGDVAKSIDDVNTPSQSLKIGLNFNETTCSCEFAKTQRSGADFITYGVNFDQILNFPWTYKQFKSYLNLEGDKNLSNFRKWLKDNKESLVFKITLSLKRIMAIYSSDNPKLDEILLEIRARSMPFYFKRLQNYAKMWTKTENVSDLILKSYLTGNEVAGRVFKGRELFTPMLYVQEVDANPCQLKTVLGTVANHFDSVVVNEFTWSAFARHSNRMDNCPNSERWINPLKPYLFFTPGIHQIWENIEAYFEKLLKERRTISGWTLQSLMFSTTDLPNDSQADSNKVPVAEFANKMKNSGYSIGCAVNTDELRGKYRLQSEESIKQFIENKIFLPCKTIWNVTDVIVLEFSHPVQSMYGNFSVYETVFFRLIIRELLLKQYPDMEVILHVKNYEGSKFFSHYNGQRRHLCNGYTFDLITVQSEIQAWAEVYQVKFIYGDAFRIIDEDDYEADRISVSFWNIPGVDGQPNDVNPIDCAEIP